MIRISEELIRDEVEFWPKAEACIRERGRLVCQEMAEEFAKVLEITTEEFMKTLEITTEDEQEA